jgi:hypothetical protein
MSSSAITGPIFSDVRRSPSGSAAAPSWAFNESTGTGIYLVSAGVLGLSTAGVQRVVVDASGNVLVGTTTNTAVARAVIQAAAARPALQVSADFNQPAISFGSSNAPFMRSDGAYLVISTQGTSGDRTLYLQSDAGVYLTGTKFTNYNAASESTLGVFGANNDTAVNTGAVFNIEWKMSGGAGGQFWYANYVTRNGTRTLGAYCNGASWVNASDIKNKEQIEDISYGLQTVLACRPVNFSWKTMRDEGGSGKKDIGFIAQELEELIPEVVTGDEGQKGVSYGNLVAVAFKAIQEQQAQIEKQSQALEALKAEVAALKAP